MNRDDYCRALRRRSGSVNSNDPLAHILAHVLQHYMPAEAFEELIDDALHGPHTYTLGWVAAHAIDAAKRLRKAVR